MADTVRDRAVEVLAAHQYDGVKGIDWDSPGGLRESCTCGWEQNYAGHNNASRRALYAAHLVDALAAAGLLAVEPEWEYGSAVLPDALAPALPKDSRESAETDVADLAQRFPRAEPCVKRRRKAVPAGPWEVCDD